MNLNNVLYTFEHRLLPAMFYKEKQAFIRALLQEEDILPKIFADLCNENGVENPYESEDFRLELIDLDDPEYKVIIISFPEPSEDALCYKELLFFDSYFKKPMLFTVEYSNANEALKKMLGDMGNFDLPETPFLCGWDAHGSHVNYGHCSPENDDDLRRCCKIYFGDE